MKISQAERLAIRAVLDAGEQFGYGNLITHLQTAWREKLITDGLPDATARACVGGDGYPALMQQDLLERGEWDETGKRYRKSASRETAPQEP